MTAGATIHKLHLQLNDFDQNHYYHRDVTIAQHPSENALRFMARILAYAINLQEGLEFNKELCADDEPEVWLCSLDSQILQWIDLGQVSEDRISKASKKAEKVLIYTYQDNASQVWWQKNQKHLHRYRNLSVCHFGESGLQQLADHLERKITLTINIQDGQIWVGGDDFSVDVSLSRLM